MIREDSNYNDTLVHALPKECDGVYRECSNTYFCPDAEKCRYENRE